MTTAIFITLVLGMVWLELILRQKRNLPSL